MEFIKKGGIPFYLTAAAGVLALVGAILFAVTNATAGFAVMSGALGIALGFIAVAAIAGCAYCTAKFGSQHFITAAVKLVALVLLFASFGILLSDRVGLASSLFTWDSHNEVGWSAFYVSITSVVFVIVSVITLIVGSFLDNKKEA